MWMGAVASAWAVDTPDPEAEIKAALAKMTEADRSSALAQRWCAVEQGSRLGSMGTPVKVVLDGKPVFLCCAGCQKRAVVNSKATIKTAEALKKVNAALVKLPAVDRPLAEAQRFCAVMNDSRLGSMGIPVKLTIDGRPVFICCQGCADDATADPRATLAKVQELRKASAAR